ncbi:tRNA-uridine aminocarboxypropyltransferase [Pseudocolwellia sp. AS88]|uniref:tRNA-uridine aminocarboxypropyltransferase n=1 Tax=Pseudocolwellia sp. AS88 TaxID=3063958 RepID=UPI0026EC693F|nr:tRNA-uridine aminocarboxypropyltransferase [Pseudocolwellia sp. AS88]MDO7083310.1 tRNA-uridine aminocarboxypropyltransferase [Pseudocolwellia sp. AS88]
MNAVHKLYEHRKSISTTVYNSRGWKVKRCEKCRIGLTHCICELTPKVKSNAGFLLLMYDTEILKPSNTGKLIADVVPDTFAFLWSRTEENTELLNVLNDEQWQPFVVFPEQYAEPEREVFNQSITTNSGKRPLFIMLDGSWREAKKMFRKSPYLNRFPVVSFNPEMTNNESLISRYQIRQANVSNQFATAEVAARVLDMTGESVNAEILDLWFDVFNFQYRKSVCQANTGNPHAIEDYQTYLASI